MSFWKKKSVETRPEDWLQVGYRDADILVRLFGRLGHTLRNMIRGTLQPFNPETWVPFRLANESDVTIRIYSATGQLVRLLSPGIMPAGAHCSQSQAVYWDGCNQMGEPVSSGVYLYTIDVGDFSATRKMLIRK